MARFEAELIAIPSGGHYVVVPPEAAAAAGLGYGVRVRGTVDGAPYRSSLMKYSGVFHLGVHKAVIAAAGVAPGDRVAVEIELDPEPLPTDAVPPDLARAIRASKTAGAGWDRTSPAHRREHVEHVLEAKQPETRARRVGKTVEALEAAARAARPARTPAKLRPRRS